MTLQKINQSCQFFICFLIVQLSGVNSASPTPLPSAIPSSLPSLISEAQIPSPIPSAAPSPLPSIQPTSVSNPSFLPIPLPTTASPTLSPTDFPSFVPIPIPTMVPIPVPTTTHPTALPTPLPTNVPSSQPSTSYPTGLPSAVPTMLPSSSPTSHPAYPSSLPSSVPIPIPTMVPIPVPTTTHPTALPTPLPTNVPSSQPSSSYPTGLPSAVPTMLPSSSPTSHPAYPSSLPSAAPTIIPSGLPTQSPTIDPSPLPTQYPTPIYRIKLSFDRKVAMTVTGSGVDAWTSGQSTIYQEALESAFPEVPPDNIEQLGVTLYGRTPTSLPTLSPTDTISSASTESISEMMSKSSVLMTTELVVNNEVNMDKKSNHVSNQPSILLPSHNSGVDTDEMMLETLKISNHISLLQRSLASSSGSAVSLVISFRITLISSDTDVDAITTDMNTQLTSLFVDGDFDTYLVTASNTLNIRTNFTVLVNETSILLEETANDVSIVTVNTAFPTQLPTIQPSSLPTNIPTMEPTVSMFIDIISLEILSRILTYVIIIVMGFLIINWLYSLLRKSMSTSAWLASDKNGDDDLLNANGSSGSSSKGSGGDIMILLLLIQNIAITTKLKKLPDSYQEFVGSFAIFNLQMAPPSWAKTFMRLKWAGNLFEDDTDETKIMRGQVFYMLSISILLMALHCLFICFVKHCQVFGNKTPIEFLFPHFEIYLCLALSMGMLDAGLGVLASPDSSSGWKIIALVEILFIFIFISFFIRKGYKFKQNSVFKPLANIRMSNKRLRLNEESDIHKTSHFDKETIKHIFIKHGSNVKQAIYFWESFGLEENDVLGYPDLMLFSNLEFKMTKIPFNKSTLFEGCRALVSSSFNNHSGRYFPADPHDPAMDVNYPWGMHFNKFTPNHAMFYFVNLLRTFIALVILNFLYHKPISQVLLLVILEAISLSYVLKDAPYVYLSDTRIEIIISLGRFLIYLFVLISSSNNNTNNDDDGGGGDSSYDYYKAETSILITEMIVLLHTILTQLYPFLLYITKLFIIIIKYVLNYCCCKKETTSSTTDVDITNNDIEENEYADLHKQLKRPSRGSSQHRKMDYDGAVNQEGDIELMVASSSSPLFSSTAGSGDDDDDDEMEDKSEPFSIEEMKQSNSFIESPQSSSPQSSHGTKNHILEMQESFVLFETLEDREAKPVKYNPNAMMMDDQLDDNGVKTLSKKSSKQKMKTSPIPTFTQPSPTPYLNPLVSSTENNESVSESPLLQQEREQVSPPRESTPNRKARASPRTKVSSPSSKTRLSSSPPRKGYSDTTDIPHTDDDDNDTITSSQTNPSPRKSRPLANSRSRNREGGRGEGGRGRGEGGRGRGERGRGRGEGSTESASSLPSSRSTKISKEQAAAIRSKAAISQYDEVSL